MVKVLHIANDYAGSTVYMNLAKELDHLGVGQVIYTAIREKSLIGKNSISFTDQTSEIIYSAILNWHIDRIFYPYKIFKILRDIQKKVDLSKIDFIHAHTWYSDGGVAYFLSRKYGIPFIVTIRNTDMNLFQKKLAYVRPFGRKVLEAASKIILISASYKPRVLAESSLQKSITKIKNKIMVVPNGVDSFWIKNVFADLSARKKQNKVNLIYVGRFTTGKNISLVQQAVIQLNNTNKDLNVLFHIVGGGGPDEAEVLKNIESFPSFFTYHGKIYDKEKLADLYRSSDIFVMPSSNETFGLVYVEAMLQGLPILYTANEGIDGFYSDKIGEKVQNPSVEEITEKLQVMIENLNNYQVPTEALKINHDWAEIAQKYVSLYKS